MHELHTKILAEQTDLRPNGTPAPPPNRLAARTRLGCIHLFVAALAAAAAVAAAADDVAVDQLAADRQLEPYETEEAPLAPPAPRRFQRPPPSTPRTSIELDLALQDSHPLIQRPAARSSRGHCFQKLRPATLAKFLRHLVGSARLREGRSFSNPALRPRLKERLKRFALQLEVRRDH